MCEDASALFALGGSGAAASPIAAPPKKDGVPAAKRLKLARYEHVSTQCLDPMGNTAFSGANLKDLWKAMSKGNKQAQYFSEFCDASPYRRGIAISRMAECMQNLGERLEDVALPYIVKGEMLSNAKSEFAILKPHLEVLNGGRASEKMGQTMASLGRGGEAPTHTPEAIRTAADAIYQHLNDTNSVLRAWVIGMSGDGLYWASYCFDKTGRAAISQDGGKMSKDEFIAAAISRLTGSAVDA